MEHLNSYIDYLNEKKPAGAPDWHDSDAPDAEGRFKDLSPKDLAAWLIKTRKKDLRKITGSLNQQIVFNRNEDPEYADKMEKTRKEVYKQLGREDLMKESKDYADEMAYGQLERCIDYSSMIRERIENGTELDPWMHSQITVAENELNSVFDAIDGDDGVVEGVVKADLKRIMTKIMGAIGYKHDPKMRQELLTAFEEDLKAIMSKHGYVMESDRKWNEEKPGPDAYMSGLDDETEEEKKEMMKKQAEMDDDDPNAYKELPGDKEAREKGKVKTSKHVKSYHELYGDDEDKNEALTDYEEKDADYDKLYKKYKYKKKDKKKKNESVVTESIRVGKVVAIKKYNPKTNRYEKMDVTITDYIKKPGSKDFVEYELKGKKKKMAFKLFKSLMESVNEEKAKGDRGPIDNKDIETALKNKVEETGVPIEFLRIIMRRGMAAWRTGHRPGAGQEQWGYARVNSFLTKQPGTWGGADKDVAKEVRDGGHDKKLKKA